MSGNQYPFSGNFSFGALPTWGKDASALAEMLGISLRTLHHREQGTGTPSGAARVLLRVAALHPEVVLKAAA